LNTILIQIGEEYLPVRGYPMVMVAIMPRVLMAPRMVRLFHLPSAVVS
jgi:hypothetical protein